MLTNVFTPPIQAFVGYVYISKGDRPQGVAGDCNSLAETHAWFDSRVAHHYSTINLRLPKKLGPRKGDPHQRLTLRVFVVWALPDRQVHGGKGGTSEDGVTELLSQHNRGGIGVAIGDKGHN